MRTQVGIVGAGPAGLLLAHLLSRRGIDSVVVENRSREYCEARIRAGVLEAGAVDLLVRSGVGDRLQREGLEHHGIHLQWPGERHHLDFTALCGRSVWVYGQTEVVKDLIRARLEHGGPLYFDVSDTCLHDVESQRPTMRCVEADGRAAGVE
ncbi:MAG: FAD-dependent monooxygenase, partial [Actinomycetes bacterium]